MKKHSCMIKHFIFVMLFICSKEVGAQSNQDFGTFFKQGVTAYQSKNFAEAQKAFKSALELQPDNVEVISNLGLVEYQLNNKGMSIAYFRRAQELDPGYDVATQGLKYVWSQLKVKEIPHQNLFSESLRESVLSFLSLKSLIAMTLLLMLASGWLIVKYFGHRKRQLKAEEAPPDFPYIGSGLSILFFVFVIITALKFYDDLQIRGTIIKEKIAVQSAPGENQSVLFEIYEGLEVIVKQNTQDYVLITYPGGMSGWIKKEDIFITSIQTLYW